MMMMRSASAASARLRVASASKLATSLRTAIKKVSAVAAPAAATTFGLSSVSSFTTFLGGDVHGTPRGSNRKWKNKPLLRREGDATFKTGKESALMLVDEVKRRDGNDTEFIQAVEAGLLSLGTVFDRSPRTAWMAKQLLEPERSVQFRVAWLDDAGVHQMNRGYLLQWCSALGPYEGSLHFGHHVNASVLKSLGFDSVFRNAVTGFNVGGAVGGADFNPLDKSEAEIQRFCQIYMTELVKYIGPDYDVPTLGMGVGKNEIGYMFGQYKRINVRGSAAGKPFLWGGNPTFLESPGFGAVHFAEALLQAHGSSLKGKRCLITGSGMGALSVAQKLLEYGAIPLSFSDSSGFIYEPEGIDQNKINTIAKIKSERGARVGRYIIASTSAQYSDSAESMLEKIPCDLCFPCAEIGEIDETAIDQMADNGCEAIIEGGHSAVQPAARNLTKKRGMYYAPSICSLAGPSIVHGIELGGNNNVSDEELKKEMTRLYSDVTQTAVEFNIRGDLYSGAMIRGFLRVANNMIAHGAV